MVLGGDGVVLPLPVAGLHGHHPRVVQIVLFVVGIGQGLTPKPVRFLFLTEDVVAVPAGLSVASLDRSRNYLVG